MTYYLGQKIKTQYGTGIIEVLGENIAQIRIDKTVRKITYKALERTSRP